MSRATSYPIDIFGSLREGFNNIFRPGDRYRQTGVVLGGLVPDKTVQYTLFDDTGRIEKFSKVYSAVDKVSEKFGKYAVHHAASLPTKLQTQHEGERGDAPERTEDLFKGENKRQRLGLPVLHVKV